MSRDDKKGILGDVIINLQESREIEVNFFNIRCDLHERKSTVHKKAEKTQHFDDEVSFPVTRAGASLVLEAWVNRKLLSPKCVGELVIDLPTVEKAGKKGYGGWLDLYAPNKQEAAVVGKTKKNKDNVKVGEVRVQVRFQPNKKAEDKFKGHVFEGNWTPENSAGTIINNPRWHHNPQYLLTVEEGCEVRIRLKPAQNQEKEIRTTFYLLEYDNDFWKGSKKRWYTINEIHKVDNFNSPVAAAEIDVKVELSSGTYVIVPATEEKEISTTFAIAVDTKSLDDISLRELPLKDDWNCLEVDGQWDKKSAGGGDITGISWTNNPQFFLTLTKKSNCCIVLNQATDEKLVGWYMIEAPNDGKKAIEYTNEIASTEKFKFTHMNGNLLEKVPAGTYAIIPCTSDADQVGRFLLSVFTQDAGASLNEVTKKWKYRKILKGTWKGKSAGGSANYPTFVDNPQYLLKMGTREDKKGLAIQLIQSCQKGEEVSVGFVAFIRDEDETERLTQDEINQDHVFLQPDGWAPNRALTVRTKVKPDLTSNLLVIPATFNPGIERGFKLVIYSDWEIDVEQLTDDESSEESSE